MRKLLEIRSTMPARIKAMLPWIMAALTGGAISVAAWGEGRAPMLAAVLPLAIAMAESRTKAFVIGLAYLMGAERAGPSFIATWFDGSLSIGMGLWLGSCLIGGAAWSLGWSSSTIPWRKALASVLAWLVTLLPPVAVISMGHPVIAWGYILPGWGWFGLAMSVIAPAGIIWAIAAHPRPRSQVVAALSGLAVIMGGTAYAYSPPETRYVGDMVAVSTKWGATKDPYEIISRVERMGRTVRKLGEDNLASAVIFPESIIQTYDPALFPILNMEILAHAAQAGQTVVLGMDLPDKGGNFQTVATAIYPDGRSATAIARQTVPVALWKPWQDKGSYLTDWTASNVISLKDGVKARIIFCYEEYIPLLSLINEAKDEHNLVVVLANTWASVDETAAVIQARHSEGIATLFGKRLLRAENRPANANSP